MTDRPGTECAAAPGKLKLPLVSVVVISYNHASFLGACLTSVAAQTYPHIQLIVIDNASTDSSGDVIRDFETRLVSVRPDLEFEPILSSENGHEIGAILQAFPRTRGSYVIFVDGDDLLLPGCVETHVKAHLMSRIAVGLTSVDMYQSTGDDIVVGTGPLVSQFVMSRRGQTRDLCRMSSLDAFSFSASSELTPDDLHYVPPAAANEWVWSPSSGLCFRREAVSFMLSPPPRIRAGADNYLVRGICAVTGGITIDRALAVYRMHGDNFFSKHPALANVHTFDSDSRAALDDSVMTAIVDCYRANMDYFGESLTDPDLFIKGIDHFAGIAARLKNQNRHSSFSIGFLLDNREAIVRAFGLRLYRKWIVQRLRPRDLPAFFAPGRRVAGHRNVDERPR